MSFPYDCVVYTDGIHIVSNDVKFLHQWAQMAGIKRHWFHGLSKGHPHYDKPKTMSVEELLDNGARLISPKEVILVCRKAMTRERRRRAQCF